MKIKPADSGRLGSGGDKILSFIAIAIILLFAGLLVKKAITSSTHDEQEQQVQQQAVK